MSFVYGFFLGNIITYHTKYEEVLIYNRLSFKIRSVSNTQHLHLQKLLDFSARVVSLKNKMKRYISNSLCEFSTDKEGSTVMFQCKFKKIKTVEFSYEMDKCLNHF